MPGEAKQGAAAAAGSSSSSSSQSLSHLLPFPAFACQWVGPDLLLVAGGGGASKTGVPNGVIIYKVSARAPAA